MTTDHKATQGTVCRCDPVDGNTKTYYVWMTASNEKRQITAVDEVYVTSDQVVFEKRSHQTVSIPRHEVYMVTCERCSAPPCG